MSPSTDPTTDYYGVDLAYIHDVGHGDNAVKSAPGIVATLREHGITTGRIVDLGCGSGLSAQALSRCGYQVWGIDWSAALIAIARERIPQSEFQVGSFWDTPIPPCHGVISVGECLNYQFDAQANHHALVQLFQRIYVALVPGGLLIFDLANPGQAIPGQTTQTFREGEDWLVLVEKTEDAVSESLTRRIISLRRVSDLYRRSQEIHRLQLYPTDTIIADLTKVGFRVQTDSSYGSHPLPPAHTVFIAQKPHQS